MTHALLEYHSPESSTYRENANQAHWLKDVTKWDVVLCEKVPLWRIWNFAMSSRKLENEIEMSSWRNSDLLISIFISLHVLLLSVTWAQSLGNNPYMSQSLWWNCVRCRRHPKKHGSVNEICDTCNLSWFGQQVLAAKNRLWIEIPSQK